MSGRKTGILSVVCVLALVFCLGAASAESVDWTCPNCGQEHNSGLFCPECGTARPEDSWTCSGCGQTGNKGKFCTNCGNARGSGDTSAASAHSAASSTAASAVLNSSVSCSMGRTTIRWTGGSGASYYVVAVAENGDVEQDIMVLGMSDTSVTTNALMPGKQYTVYLLDEDFQVIVDQKTIRIPEAGTFEDGKLTNNSVKVSIEPRCLPSGTDEQKARGVNSLSASKIISGLESGSESYGYRYTIRMPQLAKQRNYYATIYMEAPNGYLDSLGGTEVTFSQVTDGYETFWFYFLGSSFFSDMYENTGSVPAGDYTVTMYWDGMLVNQSTLRVAP